MKRIKGTIYIPFDPAAVVERLFNLPGPYRHEALKSKDLGELIRYVDDRQPLMYSGVAYDLFHKKLGAGQYRAWLDKRE